MEYAYYLKSKTDDRVIELGPSAELAPEVARAHGVNPETWEREWEFGSRTVGPVAHDRQPPREGSKTKMADYGKIAYDGYCAKSGGRSLISGAELPDWDHLSPAIQEAWRAAADAVIHATGPRRK